ncbi:MAG TPA: SCO family protein [Phnomibacter sp.]|mgnify:CR=1 FL=1|nr:SCO family protein [Phnomibacter sp.]
MTGKVKLLIYAGIFAVMMAGFYYFLFRGTDNWRSKLPVIAYVKPFTFINQAGDTVNQQATAGKVYVANYFFVTCPGICPAMNGNVKMVYEKYKGQKDFLILSHTCQPEVDSVPALRRYADSIGSDGRQWQFLTGNKLELYLTARESYHIDDPKNNVGDINDQFLHSQFLALVDRQGQVRGIYDGLKKKEIEQLLNDIADLLKENNQQTWLSYPPGNQPATAALFVPTRLTNSNL